MYVEEFSLNKLGFRTEVKGTKERPVVVVSSEEVGELASLDLCLQTVKAHRGFHLAHILKALPRGYRFEYDRLGSMLSCIDRYDRVWFSSDWDIRPEEGEEILVELENGECVWCVYSNGVFSTCGSGIIHKGITVTPFKWAWTEE